MHKNGKMLANCVFFFKDGASNTRGDAGRMELTAAGMGPMGSPQLGQVLH